jgi:hypothetical protein
MLHSETLSQNKQAKTLKTQHLKKKKVKKQAKDLD